MGFLESVNISGTTLRFIAVPIANGVGANTFGSYRKLTVLTETLGVLPQLLEEMGAGIAQSV
jgi:hypothetical protein